MLQLLATAKEDTLIFNQSTPGGYTLQDHSADANTISLIFSQPWDIVVIQAQSEEPSFPPSQVATDVYPYAHKLDSMVHKNNNCTQTMFMMTWAHANGDVANCAVYPVICTYEGMQQRLRDSYIEMTKNNNAIVAPVGAAWKMVRDSFPSINLYQADNIHPSLPGSYLQTCVLYNSIFHKPVGSTNYLGGLSANDAGKLQHMADKVALDSMVQWQQYGHYPSARFTTMLTGKSASFKGQTGVLASTEYWSFGDTSTVNVSNPVHAYKNNGTYIVTHTVGNSCFTEVQTDTVKIGSTSISSIDNHNEMYLQAYGGIGDATFRSEIYDHLEVFSADGKRIGQYQLHGSLSLNLPANLYIFRAWNDRKGLVANGKIVVH